MSMARPIALFNTLAVRADVVVRDAASADRRWLQVALVTAISAAAIEGPLRYLLNLAHLDLLIFVRDAALLGALAAFVMVRFAEGNTPVAVTIFAFLALFHSIVALVNLQTVVAPIYGLKIFVPALCGYLASEAIFRPGRRLLRLVLLLWIVGVVGATFDQFTNADLPWVGVSVEVGGIDVDIGRDWQTGTFKRVAGLTRSSINLAIVLPLLSFMLIGATKSRLLRIGVCAATLVVLYWSTQKGAILGYALAFAALALSGRSSSAPLKVAAVLATLLTTLAPTLLIYYDMPVDRGVFSFESLIERVQSMWPMAWAWIDRFPNLLGVGLGGIGGAQRFYSASQFNASDNLFIYLYANFGVASLIYLGAAVLTVVAARVRNPRPDGLALASFVFLMLYGSVISLVEDQIAALWLGATLGWLALRQPATDNITAQPHPEVRQNIETSGVAP